MKACAASGSIYVLVNGSPTADFNVKKGLCQGDPLAHFFFGGDRGVGWVG